ncbi:hypothetical protein RUM44_006498 [Polyplax serrata]|uniref:Down syndrome cell adhesion molecule-like protein Dscam2 n=1 Tax=Polyplax serrata TaxID=468196 RepID=A0ABR1AI93_POLSC
MEDAILETEKNSEKNKKDVPPRWSLPPDNHQAPLGTLRYNMDCQAEGNPAPTVTWRRGVGKQPGTYKVIPQQGTDSDAKVYPNGSLVIEKLSEEHEGYYLCEAFNGVGTGLSKRIYLTVNAPPQFSTKHKNQTSKLGSSAVLKCDVKGDRPIKIVWRKAGSTLDGSASDYRYSVKDTNATDGFLSELIIFNSLREDSGQYYCIATNTFGRDEMALQLFVQEPPDFPRNIHVIDKGSRFVKLGWVLSQDGNSPILQCVVEYKLESELWQDQSTEVTVPVGQATVLIGSLRPALTYQFRFFAENELGKSQPSEVLEVMTESEVPSGAPRNLQASAVSATELNVMWDAPEREHWNGEILGYHVGFKEQRLKDDQYQYKNVESRSGLSGETSLVDLKKYTKYSIVVQAYNALGPGPTSTEVLALTLEDVPSASPQEIRCTATTSQSLQVSWNSVPEAQVHGHLKGYKVMWENVEDLETTDKPLTKITTALSVVIHGLDKFTNYSIQVLAYTNAGEGVSSPAVYCLTNEDVPEVPRAIKAVVSNPTSIVISWLPPNRSNGVLTGYNLQIRSVGGPSEKDGKSKRHAVPADHTSYEEEGLSKRGQYEFTVAAATKMGEGVRTLPITLSPSPEVRAAIYSFGVKVVQPWKSDVRLPCRSVGKPEPSLVWKQWNQALKSSARYKIHSDGTLQIVNLMRDDSGNYSCFVENVHGSDSIIHYLQVQVPPSSPIVHATSATSSTLNIQWKQGDNGGAPIQGYYLYYKRENNDWELIRVGRKQTNYLISDLNCGTPYQIYMQAYNSIGKGEKSQTIKATTDGSKPGSMAQEAFLTPNATFATLFLEKWQENSCPITHFEINYRKFDEDSWTLISSSLLKQKFYLLRNLQPGTEYLINVKVHNKAGSIESDYRFSTLQKVTAPSPSLTRHSGQADVPFYLDLRIVLPFFISCLVILAAVVGIYYCWNKKESMILRESNSSRGTLDNKFNLHHREQYYATVKKPLKSPVRDLPTLERIPEYAEDIYPYATFQLNQVTAAEVRCTSGAPLDRKGEDIEKLERDRGRGTPISSFLYHDSMLTTAETLKLKEILYITAQMLAIWSNRHGLTTELHFLVEGNLESKKFNILQEITKE